MKTHRVSFVSSASLIDFRNHSQTKVELAKQRNVFIGENGQGKSNLLEALYLISTSRSFRGAKDSEMTRIGEEGYTVTAVSGEYDEELQLVHRTGHRRQALLNGQKLGKVQDIVGRLPAVCFSTNDLLIASGEPSARRAFIDTELSISSPAYLSAITTFKRSIEHRNATLRAIREGTETVQALSPWDVKAAESGAAVRRLRIEYLEKLGPIAVRCHGELCEDAERLALAYVASDDATSSDENLQLLMERQQRDIAAGTTTAGAHRDDILLTVDDRSLRSYGSQGQQRTAVLALKLAVAAFWKTELACLPMLLLDDIMSDLDERRRSMVLAVSGAMGQVVITATDMNQVPPEVRSGAKVFRVCQGAVITE